MTSLQIKVLISIAGVSVVYAFARQIQLSREARKLGTWLQKERPDLWSELNSFARNYHGGHPGLKLLYRKNVVGLPVFNQRYEQLRSLERKFFWSIGIASLCIGLVIIGSKYWGWHW